MNILEETLDELQNDAGRLKKQIDYYTAGYAANHFGGQSPSQFAAILTPVQTQYGNVLARIAQLTIQAKQALVAAAATPAPAAAAPAQVPLGVSANGPSPAALAMPTKSIFSSPLLWAAVAAGAWLFLRGSRK